ncbi:MAG: ABC transporter substrate-binding protein [Gemmatimonadaceae bacterium]|nr:ABC transporter substrate-binding protein [Gemmatimonadaceae bacterium]
MFSQTASKRRFGILLLALCASTVAACRDSSDDSSRDASRDSATASANVLTPADTDDFGAPFPDASSAQRVVTLNPTSTEIIFALGENSRLVGRSDWDEFPKEAKQLPSLGNGIKPNVEAVLAARPTLVVLYATPDNRPAVEAFTRAGVKTLALRVDRIAGFHKHVEILGRVFGVADKAKILNDSVSATLRRVQSLVERHVPVDQRPTALWPVWNTPPMVIGGGSYMDELLTIAGARNVFHDNANPSPQVSVEEIVRRNPQQIVVGPARAKELAASPIWRAVPAVRDGHFAVMDPELTGRPSVQLGMAAMALARSLHPALADSLK